MNACRRYFSQFQSDQAALPSYYVSGAPTQNQVNAAVSSAQGAVTAAINGANADIAQANTMVNQAYAAASAASNAGNCGTASQPPTPQTTIPSVW
jgi:hypothetical protein